MIHSFRHFSVAAASQSLRRPMRVVQTAIDSPAFGVFFILMIGVAPEEIDALPILHVN